MGPSFGRVGQTLIGQRLSARISCRIQVHSKYAGYGIGDTVSTRVGVVMLGIRVIVVIRIHGGSCLTGSDCGSAPAGLQAKVGGRSTVLRQPIEQIRRSSGVDRLKMDGRQVSVWDKKRAMNLRKLALFCRETRQ